MTAAHSTLNSMLMQKPRHIHLIGVAGSGMSGIAGLLLSLGHHVSGCDRVSTTEVERLQSLGLDFHTPQSAEYVRGAELVIYSSAIKPGNPAYDEALRLGLPVFRRAEALQEVLSQRRGIIVAGMHGKTTVSSMAAHVLRVGGLKPSHYIGAEIPLLGTNAHWDPDGEWMVAEGDESDGTLALYQPECAIILNIEPEHLDHYADLAAIEAVFRRLLAQTSGTVFYCADDPVATRLCFAHSGAIGYGFSADARYSMDRIASAAGQSTFRALRDGKELGTVILNVPGRHNLLNALAVIALATELGIDFPDIAQALGTFRSAKRRFEEVYRDEQTLIIDDYGHHPTEIRATLAAARETNPRRVITLFQPHRFTRTQALRDEFGRAFAAADQVLVTSIYPASEQPIPGISGQTIVDAIRQFSPNVETRYQPEMQRLRVEICREFREGDLILSLGAGNIHEQATLIAHDLRLARAMRTAMQRGELRLYEPVARHTTMRVGGPAQFWIEPETVSGLGNLMRYFAESGLPWLVIGRGSNLIVRDGGIRGAVVRLSRGEFVGISADPKAGRITAGAGVKLKQLSYAARDACIGGFEWFEGIPGTVGGALRMNAGAMEAETFGQVVSVETMDLHGQIKTIRPGEIDVQYRNVPWFQEHIALSATFTGIPGVDRKDIERRLAESMAKRKSSQPAASSAGCIFKNPTECPAGKLLDELGLKGLRRGAVCVSETHGNFIVNQGGGTAADVLGLVSEIRAVVREKRGIDLAMEAQVVGQDIEEFA